MSIRLVTAPTEVCAVLTDPTFAVPPVPAADQPGGMAWLRAMVARFSSGPDHERRRSLATELLAGITQGTLRTRALDRTRALLTGGVVDLMVTIARPVPVGVLAEAIGLPHIPVDAVRTVAAAYHPQASAGATAEAAVATLVEACGGQPDESAAARIGLLVQACDATAGLVGNAAFALFNGPGEAAERVVGTTLRTNPPVVATTRMEGKTVLRLNLTEHPFGAGAHRCPGREHATAIAAGILDAIRHCRPLTPVPSYPPSPNLRVPASCELVTP